MTDSAFNMVIGVVVGVFMGGAVVALGTKLDLSPDRQLQVTRPDGTQQSVKIYRGDDCRRWGEVIRLTAGEGYRYSCG